MFSGKVSSMQLNYPAPRLLPSQRWPLLGGKQTCLGLRVAHSIDPKKTLDGLANSWRLVK
jgi:hypothetical protein